MWSAHDLRSPAPARPAGDVEGHERVPGEQERSLLEKQGAAAGGVTGGVEDAGGAGHVYDLSVLELVERRDRWRACDPLRQVAPHVERVPRPPEVPHDTAIAQTLLAEQV